MRKTGLKVMGCAIAASLALSSACFANIAEGTFKVGFDSEYPPYSFMDENGEYTGLDVDLAKAVAELEGWEFIPAPLVWDTRDDVLNSGEIDCIWSAYEISGREDLYAWTEPYMNSGIVFMVRDDSGINDMIDLAGRVVGVQSGSSALDALSEGGEKAELGASFKRIWQFTNSTNLFMALINSDVNAIVNDPGVLAYYVGDEPGYRILSEPLKEEGYCGVAFRPEDTESRDTVQAALETLAENGTVAAIAQKYYAEDIIALENVAPAPEEASTEGETGAAEEGETGAAEEAETGAAEEAETAAAEEETAAAEAETAAAEAETAAE